MLRTSDVTIIIPHLGATKEQQFSIKNCFDSLIESGFPGENIIIAFNGISESTSTPTFDPTEQGVSLIGLTKQGQCTAVNAAAATVTTPWIMVSNDDMMYAPGWFERLVAPIDESILCISPILVEPRPGAPTFITEFCGGAGGDFNKEKWLYFANSYMPMYQGLCRPGFNLPFLIRKDVWDLVGGYDVNYDPWSSNSDSDLEYKLKLAGVQPYQNTNCPVYHFSQTSGTFEPKNRPSWEKNWQYFIDKWGFPRTDDGIWEATFEVPTTNMGRIFTPWWEGFYGK